MLQANAHQHGLDAEHGPPIVVALMPSTPRQRAMAAGVAVIILALAALVAPFVNVQIGRIDSVLPVLQTVLSAADLLTATLLFAQYSVQPHRALLIVASGYIFAGSFASRRWRSGARKSRRPTAALTGITHLLRILLACFLKLRKIVLQLRRWTLKHEPLIRGVETGLPTRLN